MVNFCKTRLCWKVCKTKLILLLIILVLLLYINAEWFQTHLRVLLRQSKERYALKYDAFHEVKQLSRRLTSEKDIARISENYKGMKRPNDNHHASDMHLASRMLSVKNSDGADRSKFRRHGTKSLLQKKRLPQCIIIGMRKAGTKALITFLELNKRIKAAKKEVHFFDTDENYYKGYDWYREQMPYSFEDQITIEKTPRYVIEDKVPERILQMNASIKLILIVKEPVLRAISEYAQNYAKSERNRKLTFEEYALKRVTGEVNRDYKPINRSIYYQHMPKWLSKFRRQQLLIVDGDTLVDSPFQELNKIETFLGLKPEITKDMFYYNRTKGFNCAKRDEFSEPVCLGENKGRKHPDVLLAVITKLQEYYKPWNELFFKQVGQRFDWP